MCEDISIYFMSVLKEENDQEVIGECATFPTLPLLKGLIPHYIHVSSLINLSSPIELSHIIKKLFSFCLRVH